MWHRLRLLVRHAVQNPLVLSLLIGFLLFLFGGESAIRWLCKQFGQEPDVVKTTYRITWIEPQHCDDLPSLRERQADGELDRIRGIVFDRSLLQREMPDGEAVSVLAPEAEMAEWLQQTPKLRSLILKDLELTPAMMAEVARCESLQWLGLLNVDLSEELLQPLAEHSNLYVLDLSGSRFEHALAPLARLPKLTTVFLTQPESINDAHVKELLNLPQFQRLVLNGWYSQNPDAGISADGIAALARHPELVEVWVPEHRDDATRDLSAHLKAALPECDVRFMSYSGRLHSFAFKVGLFELLLLFLISASLIEERSNSQSALLPRHGSVSGAAHVVFGASVMLVSTAAFWFNAFEARSIVAVQSAVLVCVLAFVEIGVLARRGLNPVLLFAVSGLGVFIAMPLLMKDEWIGPFLYGELMWAALVLVVVSSILATVIALQLLGLPKLVEEVAPNSHIASAGTTNTATTTRPNQVRDNWITHIDQWLLERSASTVLRTGFWSELKQLRRGTRWHAVGGVLAFAMMQLFTLLGLARVVFEVGWERVAELQLSVITQSLVADSQRHRPLMTLMIFCGLGACTWTLMRLEQWTRRLKTGEGELLRPVTRERLRDLYFAAIAIDVVLGFLAGFVPYIAALLCLGLRDWDLRLLQDIVVGATACLALIAVALWTFFAEQRLRNQLIIMPLVLALPAAFGAFEFSDGSAPMIASALVFFIGIAASFSRQARRRFMVAEFGY